MIRWESERVDPRSPSGRTRHTGWVLGKRLYIIDCTPKTQLDSRYWYVWFWHEGGFTAISSPDESYFGNHAQLIRALKDTAEAHFKKHVVPTLVRALETTKGRDPVEGNVILKFPEARRRTE